MHTHLDLSSAQEDVWMRLRSHIEQYDAAIFDAPSFARSDMPMPTYIVPPAIDPNSARNMPLPDDVVRSVLDAVRHRPVAAAALPCFALRRRERSRAASSTCG